ncbi:hypothetical protein BDK51DRAFT_29846 [Blyttiomyces helicus]|uniref:Uncharacterized protein n=1 Tax=Blyttiomyces helicus TaxID=388810 RepID=A0A4P9WSZ2_9FUNG|nr:hypothetical protein BDK51DRAFT_29846 [Blyttiomyces helicus]|eukprot:RKO94440.1 hypothetical protein BDK51DRAFT_29846 [Blyttiomyces helicus]
MGEGQTRERVMDRTVTGKEALRSQGPSLSKTTKSPEARDKGNTISPKNTNAEAKNKEKALQLPKNPQRLEEREGSLCHPASWQGQTERERTTKEVTVEEKREGKGNVKKDSAGKQARTSLSSRCPHTPHHPTTEVKKGNPPSRLITPRFQGQQDNRCENRPMNSAELQGNYLLFRSFCPSLSVEEADEDNWKGRDWDPRVMEYGEQEVMAT